MDVWESILTGEASKLRLLLELHSPLNKDQLNQTRLPIIIAWILSCMFTSKNKIMEINRILREYNLFENEVIDANIIEIVFKYTNFNDMYTKPYHILATRADFILFQENSFFCLNKNAIEFVISFEKYLNKEKTLHYIPLWRRKKIFHRECYLSIQYIKSELDHEFVKLDPGEIV